MRVESRTALNSALVVFLMFPAVLSAAEPRNKKNQAPQSVDFFQALQNRQIELRVVVSPKFQLVAAIANRSNVPLEVKMPDVFVAMPIAGLVRTDANAAAANPNPNPQQPPVLSPGITVANGTDTQSVAGGFWRSGSDAGPAVLTLAPGQVAQVGATVVCLEPGKNNPKLSLPYTMLPIQYFAPGAEVSEVCRMLAQGRVSQPVAQIAAWHFNNHFTWQQLASSPMGITFSKADIQTAMQLATVVANTVRQRKQPSSRP